ncbi:MULTISPECIES: oxidoreductase [Staphylococcus]|uniref:oxidoreductase n=1 Tax=Staphylococcus TaxID=1279 RepID=UPI000E04427E|nr:MULTISPECIES: oxidoreductase [Staphylococcus]MDI9230533.1 oxidoreductase [Staphylococcus caprae]SUL94570.1 2-dehydropantoate 2-reductase [Staphylococcus caprae]
MTIAIIGPGAVGTTIAAELKAILPETKLIGRRKQSMTYFPENTSKAITIDVSSYDNMNQTFDVIIIAVKTHQLGTVINQLKALAHPDTLIILSQNGYGQVQRIPYQHVHQAVVYISGQKVANQVTHFRDYRLHVQDTPKTRELKTLLSSTKIELILENNIEHKIWYKLLVNLGINSITAIGHQTAKILQLPEISQLCRNILEDGLKVAQSEGIHFPKQTVDDIMAIYKGYPDEMGTSMYYDVMNQQPLEVEAIQGYIYERARYHQLETPYLDSVYIFLKSYHRQFTQTESE